ncbi:MAG: YceI family protein [Bacteroidota bacterium]|nr:YceI family protein [Bacteroidota bacterium]
MNKIFSFILIVSIFMSCESRYASEATEAITTDAVLSGNAGSTSDMVFIDTKSSVIEWKGTKFNKSRFHAGTIQITNGVLQFSNDKLTGGYFTANLNTIKVTDIPPHEKEAIHNLTKHLKDDFEATTYPSAKFVITNVKYITKDSMAVSGDLKMKDVVRNITIPAKAIEQKNGKAYFTAFQFNRFEWNIGKSKGWLEQRMVDKEVELKIRLITKE